MDRTHGRCSKSNSVCDQSLQPVHCIQCSPGAAQASYLHIPVTGSLLVCASTRTRHRPTHFIANLVGEFSSFFFYLFSGFLVGEVLFSLQLPSLGPVTYNCSSAFLMVTTFIFQWTSFAEWSRMSGDILLPCLSRVCSSD